MNDYTKKAKCLTEPERKAINEFIEKVVGNADPTQIVMFGSALYQKKHSDVDLAVLLDKELKCDPYTGERNFVDIRGNIPSGYMYEAFGGKTEDLELAGILMENKLKLNGAKIHYLTIEEDRADSLLENLRRNCYHNEFEKESLAISGTKPKMLFEVFLGAILEDGLVLYKRPKKKDTQGD